MNWRPIETAPKDESVFLAYVQDFGGHYAIMKWSSGDDWGLFIYDDANLCDVDPSPCQPTHWTPLPEPPQ